MLQRPDGNVSVDGVSGKAPDKHEGDGHSSTGGPQANGEKSKTNIFDAARDYKKHMKSEHRRGRGLMQWKVCFSSNIRS